MWLFQRRAGRAIIMDYARDCNRTILRIVTITWTPSSTTCATKRFSLHHSGRPEEIYVAVCAMGRLRLRGAMSVLTLGLLDVIALSIHIPLAFTFILCHQYDIESVRTT